MTRLASLALAVFVVVASAAATVLATGIQWGWTPPPAALPPNGPAGGDLAGTYPNPTVAQLTPVAGITLVTATTTIRPAASASTVAGAAVTYSTGQGGTGTAGTDGGAGGLLTVRAGNGGAGSAAKPSGRGGALTLDAGAAGANGGGGDGGGGAVTLGTTNATSVDIGKAGITDTITGTTKLASYGAGVAVLSAAGVVSSVAPSTSGKVLTSDGTTWNSTALPASFPPSGAAGGDLAGTYPNPTLATTSALDALDPFWWSFDAASWRTSQVIVSSTVGFSTANSARLMPFWTGRGFTTATVSIHVTIGAAASHARVGIYTSSATGSPSALLGDSGAFDTSVTGVLTLPLVVVLPARTHVWLCWLTDSNSVQVVMSLGVNYGAAGGGWTSGNLSIVNGGIAEAVTYGALPDPFAPAPTTWRSGSSNYWPIVGLQ